MKDRMKKAFKRAASGLMAVLLVVCLVGTPRAKAVVSEGALLGSIFGSLLVSMGYSWAAENMDVPTFGESIYKLIQEHDEANKDNGVQLLRDLNIAALTSGRPGTIQFNYAWIQAARSFAEWFQEKFFIGDNMSAVVAGTNFSCVATHESGLPLVLNFPKNIEATSDCQFEYGVNRFKYKITQPSVFITSVPLSNPALPSSGFYLNQVLFTKGDYSLGYSETYESDGYKYTRYDITQDILNSYTVYMYLDVVSITKRPSFIAGDSVPLLSINSWVTSADASSLTAEKPQEVHYPNVAEDGSQVYEVTYEGVTATDIEGIIQGAVDRILAGTASIVGSVEQAGTAEEVTNPEIEPYKVSLSSVFPFCIPFDVYNMVTMFVAEPEAPNAEWTFTLPWSSQEYSVGWDLAAFDGVARICRDMQLVLFAVGLAVITYKVIKW